MFEKAQAALCDKDVRPRIMRYLRKHHPDLFKRFAGGYRKRVRAVANAFKRDGRKVELEIVGEKIVVEEPVLNRPIVCRSCLIGFINLFVDANVGFLPAEDEKGRRSGTHIFGKAYFWRATFHGDAYFWRVTFHGEAYFRGATFHGEASFSDATSHNDAWFCGATFSRDVSFAGATFSGYAWFEEAIFSGSAYFEKTSFTNNAFFGRAIFSGDAWFWRATFGGATSFRESTFAVVVSFEGAAFSEIVDFAGAVALSVNFAVATFKKTCYMRPIVAQSLNFERTVFSENILISTPVPDFADRKRKIAAILEERKGEFESEFENIKRQAEYDKESEAEIHTALEMVKRALDLLKRWYEAGRGIMGVNFEDTLVQGELRCDFKHLKPQKGAPPILRPHRIALGLEEPEEEEKSENHWAEAQKQYAWLKEQYRKQGAYGNEDDAHWWASECARRGRKAVAGGSWFWRTAAFAAFWCFLLIKALRRKVRSAVVRRFLRFGLAKFRKDNVLPWRSTFWVGIVEGGVVVSFMIAGLLRGVGLGLAPLLLFAAASFLFALPRIGVLVLYRGVFGYGVRPRNVILTALVVVLVCGMFFTLADAKGLLEPLQEEKNKRPFGTGPASSIMTGLYFSVITFATVGYGDVSATGWAAGLAMVEGVLGIVLNAALIVVIFRKLIR